MKISTLHIAILIWTATITLSCSKNKNEEVGEQSAALVEVFLDGATYEAEEDIRNRAANPFQTEKNTQRNTIDIGNGLLMVASLTPEDSKSAKAESQAAIETSNLGSNIRYRVLVYTAAGSFVTERDYIRGQEANTAELRLNGGSTYTFVVVSLNQSNASIPATTPTNTATRTLSNSRITTTTGTTDLMYFQRTMTVTGNSINRLNITLKHRKARIDVTINSAQTGYNISALSAAFTPHNNGMLVNLSDGSHTRSGTNTESNIYVTPSTLGSQSVTGGAVINYTNNNTTVFTISSITIGDITATNLTPFTSLNITNGIKYKLILNIVPNDQFITHQGRPAARINGVIWARHNVGAVTTTDPDEDPMTVDRHGDYFQWGRLARSGSATSGTANPFINNNEPANNTWNSGTELAPIKTAADPCPTGYRIPTWREYNLLIADTDQSNIGPFSVNNNLMYSSAKVFTSKRNSNVKLTFPTQGRFHVSGGNAPPYTTQPINSRGANAYYHSSYSSANPLVKHMYATSTSVSMADSGTNRSSKSSSAPIRCVGI